MSAGQEEARHLDQRIDEVTDESVAATGRIKALTVETHEAGVGVLLSLHQQREQLENVEDKMNEMNADLKQTDRHLSKLERWGLSLFPNTKWSEKFKKSEKRSPSRSPSPSRLDPSRERGVGSYSSRVGQSDGPFIKKITGDPREEQMERDLQ